MEPDMNIKPENNIKKWQVQKQSSGEVLFIGDSWEEANEVAKLLARTRHYNHNLLIVVGVVGAGNGA
jgi:chromosomal replication initiation ATPase DnaA